MKTCDMHRCLQKLSLLVLVLVFVMGCTVQEEEQIVFNDYPDLKLGFTTQNFIEVIQPSLESAKHFIDYADENGYHWIELRDPDAVLSFEECQDIAAYAQQKGIGIGYANQRGFLDEDFWDVFNKGLKNATAFKQGTQTIRALLSGQKFTEDSTAKGFTPPQFQELVDRAQKAGQMAKENGLKLIVENGGEPLKGDGETYFGTTEFFQAVGPDVYWQFDTANFFSGARGGTAVEDAKQFFQDHIDRLSYLHLKAAQNGEAQPALTQNELDFDYIFSMIAKHDINYVSIELFAIDDREQIYENHARSIEFLQKQGYISMQ
jgi:sugar phosphate isomerase/epimerase